MAMAPIDYRIKVDEDDLQQVYRQVQAGFVAQGLDFSDSQVAQQASKLLLIRSLAKGFAEAFQKAGGKSEDARSLLVSSIYDELGEI